MRVLLPLSPNDSEGENTASDCETIEGIEIFEASDFGIAAEASSEDPILQALIAKEKEFFKSEDDRKLPPKPSVGTFDNRNRPSPTNIEPSLAPPFKKSRAAAKKPPPLPQPKTLVDDSKMTAPKFLEEEQRQDEVLENEPPPVPPAAAAQRFFAASSPEQDDDGDPALSPHDNAYVQALKKKGLEIVPQAGDGNCLFRAVSLQVYGDPNMHGEVRTRCMDFMAVNEEHFGEFVTGETFAEYVARKRLDGVHGNNPEIQAISELYNRPVEVYTPDRGGLPINIFHKEYGTADIPIRLSYHDGNHYNAVVDPIRPTAGLGLGLPGLQPGLADKQQMATAVTESDQQMDYEKALKESEQELSQAYEDELQRALKESSESVAYMYKQKALALSDIDATSMEMEQRALESSLQSYVQTELGRKKRASPEDEGSRARQRSASPDLPIFAPAPTAVASAVSAASPPPVAAAAAAVAAMPAAAASSTSAGFNQHDNNDPYEYPPVVQELVMNGFELSNVVRAYELIGDNFDNLLSFLCSNGGYS